MVKPVEGPAVLLKHSHENEAHSMTRVSLKVEMSYLQVGTFDLNLHVIQNYTHSQHVLPIVAKCHEVSRSLVFLKSLVMLTWL